MNVLFRASMIGKLMTEPRSKAEGPLSMGAKAAIRDMAAQQILAIEFESSSKEMEKGNECEPDAIHLLNHVRGLALAKNAERRSDGHLTGECDLHDSANGEGYDLKTAWSAATFPILPDDIGGSQRTLYEWQCRAYMALWDARRWHVAYALVNTPERLIRYEPQSMHFFDHIPSHMRLTVWTIERDAAKEAAMREKAQHARNYYAEVLAEFDRTHQPAGSMPASTPWEPNAAAQVCRADAAQAPPPASAPAPRQRLVATF